MTQRIHTFSRFFMTVSLVLSVAGCGRERSETEASVSQESSPADQKAAEDYSWMENLFDSADEALGMGQTNDAIEVFAEALEDPDLRDKRPFTFGMMTRFILSMDMRKEARSRIESMVEQDVETARNAMYEYYGDLSRRGDYREMNDWAGTLIEKDLPGEIKLAALGWKLQAVTTLKEGEELVRDVVELLEKAESNHFPELMNEVAGDLLQRDQTVSLTAILDELAAAEPPSQGMDQVQADIRTQLAVKTGDWAEAEKQLGIAAEILPDARLARLFRLTVAAARRNGREEFIDNTCRMMVEGHEDKPRSRKAAARAWMYQAKESGSPALVADRMEALREEKISTITLYQLFSSSFYDTIDSPEVLVRMMDFGERLLASVEDEERRGAIRTYLLDGSFVAHNYDVALDMIEEGIPQRDAQWHALAKSKVSAHKALVENRPRDAVEHFRDFMHKIESSPEKEDTADPASGIVHTREMILGRNAKRIGDILEGIGETDEARQAYEKARQYYRSAIEKLDDAESDSSKLARKELNAIPDL